jgi:hypothetical protein
MDGLFMLLGLSVVMALAYGFFSAPAIYLHH